MIRLQKIVLLVLEFVKNVESGRCQTMSKEFLEQTKDQGKSLNINKNILTIVKK